MNNNLGKLQDRLLELMKVFQKICEENKLCYYVLGGTCLGAVRHQGFIPWDDDVDVGMPRQDYDRLLALPTEKFPEWMERRHFRTVKNYPYYYLKLMDRRTTLIEQNNIDQVGGVFIDIFPLDGAHAPHFGERLRYKRIRLLNRLMQLYYTDGKAEDIFRKALWCWAKMQNIQKICEKLDKAVTAVPFGSTGYFASYTGYYKEKEWMPMKILGRPVYLEFEDIKVCAPEQAERYLTALYGDYRKLPPPEERGNHHNFSVVELDTPYCRYGNLNEQKDKKHILQEP